MAEIIPFLFWLEEESLFINCFRVACSSLEGIPVISKTPKDVLRSKIDSFDTFWV